MGSFLETQIDPILARFLKVKLRRTVSEVESHISKRFCTTLGCSVNRYSDRSRSEYVARTGIRGGGSKYSGVRTVI